MGGKMKKQQVEEEQNLNDAITTTITTTDGRVLTISNFISTFDETAKKRLEIMNQKLRGMEMQMEALEAEMSKAITFSD
ncbi:Phosphoribosylglycinamide synthetase C-domain-containing protein [Dioscorea alata]|uniref:Phosphoribosylglycinamide synthetase C-domain-containing protein n=1 Tax=Dioscorea alata TaxID=55571 RepID=A0ACB7TTF4_DIOAL|nr:Phosphoribosylglycinamide synthetase C-domain-containing protein [Dioscorea alata]